LLLALASLPLGAAEQKPRYLLPVDQAESDPSFAAFRAELLATIERKDVAAVKRVLAADIKASFGGETGIADFHAMWRINEADSELWAELGTVLRLGGSFDREGRFIAPYVFSRFPRDLEAMESLVVIGRGVALRAEPKAHGALLARLTYEIVTAAPPDGPEVADRKAWVKVIAANGHMGYVAATLIRSPIDYRAGFAKRNGEWRMIFFVAGD
jgi:hypothetical protein